MIHIWTTTELTEDIMSSNYSFFFNENALKKIRCTSNRLMIRREVKFRHFLVPKMICFEVPIAPTKLAPIGSMYGIFIYIWLIFMVNVGKYMDPMGHSL